MKNQEEYIKNLMSANNLLHNDIINNDGFSEEELVSISERMKALIDQLNFWVEEDNSERFVYELKNHIQWMLDTFGE
ncbi:MAG: hypothetical protein MUQ75_00875 [Crocinitomicaceae bacterium]|nr:hypothetical protein [Crocinitomicaceae bacterium]